jgi:ribose/xylose/arabinose/galactoside ABC-type transport system permease subunit
MRQRNSRLLDFCYAVMGCAWAFAGMIGFQRLSLTSTYTTQDWGLPALTAVALGMGWFAGVLALRGQSRRARLLRHVLFVGLWLLFLTIVQYSSGSPGLI